MASIHEQKEQATQITLAAQHIQHLRTQLQGRALVPDDDDYDNVRSPWDKVNFDQYPQTLFLEIPRFPWYAFPNQCSGPPPGGKFQQRIDMGERAWSAAKPTQPKGDPP